MSLSKQRPLTLSLSKGVAPTCFDKLSMSGKGMVFV